MHTFSLAWPLCHIQHSSSFMSSWLSGHNTCLVFWTLHSQVNWDAPSSKSEVLKLNHYLVLGPISCWWLSNFISVLSSDLDNLTIHLTSSLGYLRSTSNILDLEAGRMMAPPKDVYALILRTVTMLHGKRDFAGMTNLLDYYSDRPTVIKRVRGSQEGRSQRRWCDHPGSRGRKEDGMWDHKPRNENSPLKLEKARRQMVPWRLQKEPALLTFWL